MGGTRTVRNGRDMNSDPEIDRKLPRQAHRLKVEFPAIFALASGAACTFNTSINTPNPVKPLAIFCHWSVTGACYKYARFFVRGITDGRRAMVEFASRVGEPRS